MAIPVDGVQQVLLPLPLEDAHRSLDRQSAVNWRGWQSLLLPAVIYVRAGAIIRYANDDREC